MTFCPAREVPEGDRHADSDKGLPATDRARSIRFNGHVGHRRDPVVGWRTSLSGDEPQSQPIWHRGDHQLLIDIVPSKRRTLPRNSALATSFGHADNEEI